MRRRVEVACQGWWRKGTGGGVTGTSTSVLATTCLFLDNVGRCSNWKQTTNYSISLTFPFMCMFLISAWSIYLLTKQIKKDVNLYW